MLEIPLVAICLLAFWHHSPPIRDQWVWLLLGAIPFFAYRLIRYRRLWTWTPIDIFSIAFIILSIINFNLAPYHRQDYWVLLSRPLSGMWLYIVCVEQARQSRQIMGFWWISAGLSLVLGIIALGSSDWTSKSQLLLPIIEHLPIIDTRQFMPDMLLKFNVNEIAGAMVWLIPISLGMAYSLLYKSLRITASIGSILILIALILGQSRFALIGIIIGMSLFILLARRKRSHLIYGFLLIGLLITLEASLVFNVFPSPTTSTEQGINDRDENSLTGRLDIWDRALQMIRDYPLTGVGMSMYRTAVRTETYIIPRYIKRNNHPPHAHNILLQAGADLGLGGILILGGWLASSGWMLYQAYHKLQGKPEQLMTLAVASALLAFFIFGMGDAITLWDRFQFLFWWVLGLVGALYTHAKLIEHKILKT
ncbi:hypothetical protein MASR2M15_17460 [Anaerolineales bacterium]